jgi:nitrile hydratase accessory protein
LNAPEENDSTRVAPDAPVFQEPWQAQAFALAVALQDRGAFTWAEWSKTLAQTIQKTTAPREGDDSAYYQSWLDTLEQLVAEKELVGAKTLSTRKEAWRRAAHATPHGSPILLENDPMARS